LKILICIILPLNSLRPSLKWPQFLYWFDLKKILNGKHVRAEHPSRPEELAVALNCV
jgi:hypothetical protein